MSLGLLLRKFSITVSFFLFIPLAHSQSQNFVDLAVGESHVCGLAESGEVICATNADSQRFDSPADLQPLTAIAAGQQHTCGITLEGGAVCWGSNAFGVLNVPDFSAPLVSISAGTNHTCAIDNTGRAVCWGLDDNEQTQVPNNGLGNNGLGFINVDAHQNISCGVELNGDISCWSTDPTLTDTSSLTGTFVDVGVGSGSGCGLTDAGDIQCWRSVIDPPNNGPYTELTVNSTAICGLTQAQTLDCTLNPASYSTEEEVNLYNTNALFVSIDARTATSRNFNERVIDNVCGITVNGTIECLNASMLEGVPDTVTGSSNDELSLDLNLTANVSGLGSIQVELFWTPLSGTVPITLVEIYRNNELIDTVNARFSYFDSGSSFLDSSDTTVSYQIRTTDGNGNFGDFSNTIVVDTVRGTVSTDALDNFDPPERVEILSNVALTTLGENSNLVSWSGPRAGEAGLIFYEIRIDNQVVGVTRSDVFLLDSSSAPTCFVVSVAAIGNDNTILDFQTDIRQITDGRRNCDRRLR